MTDSAGRVHDCECIRPHDPIHILGHSVRCVACGQSMPRNTHAVHLRTGWAHRFVSACTPAITCPRCGMTSHNPNDVREGYCGHCHDWTGNSGP